MRTRAPLLRSVRLEPVPEAVGEVRAFVAACCADWGLSKSADVAVLLASELATNAVRYARTPVTVWLGRKPDRLVLSVEDESPESAVPQPGRVLDESGRGLQLVDALAERWGEAELDKGKRVWAEIRTN